MPYFARWLLAGIIAVVSLAACGTTTVQTRPQAPAMTATAVVRIEAPVELEDQLVAELWALGCEGSWSETIATVDRIRIHAFFASAALPDEAAFTDRLARDGVVLSPAEGVPDRDWLADWRSRG